MKFVNSYLWLSQVNIRFGDLPNHRRLLVQGLMADHQLLNFRLHTEKILTIHFYNINAYHFSKVLGRLDVAGVVRPVRGFVPVAPPPTL